MTDLEIVDSFERTAEDAVDTAVGGLVYATEPLRRPRTIAARARRRGADVNEEIAEQVSDTVDTALGMPERLLHLYIRRLRQEARREDAFGAAARLLLQSMNMPAANAAKFFARIERETELPRQGRGRGRTTATGRRTSTARGRTTGTARGGARQPARGRAASQSPTRGRGAQTRGRAATQTRGRAAQPRGRAQRRTA